MKILTFDTALNKTYICLSDDDKIITQKTIESSEDKYHSAFLIKEIANILKLNKLTMQDIEALGINVGPGSFTGIRACTTVGRVIAQQINVPLVPVSSMEILSKISKKNKTFVVMDARKKSAYIACYENNIEVMKPQIIAQDKLAEVLKDEKSDIITDPTMCKLLEDDKINSVNFEADSYPICEYLANIVNEKIKTNDDFNWAKVKPLYIQKPSIFGK